MLAAASYYLLGDTFGNVKYGYLRDEYFNPFHPACHLRDDIQNEKKSIFRSAVLSEDKYHMFDMTKRTRGLTNIKMAVIDIVYSHIFDSVFLFFIEKYSDSRSHILFSLLLLDCSYAK